MRKGQTNNPNGRPKGSKNRNTEKIREAYQKLIEGRLDSLNEDLDLMEPRERVKAIIDLSKYVLPTMQSVAVSAEEDANEFELYLKSLRRNDWVCCWSRTMWRRRGARSARLLRGRVTGWLLRLVTVRRWRG